MSEQINIDIKAKDNASPAFNSVIKALTGVEVAAKGTDGAMSKFASSLDVSILDEAARKMDNLSKVLELVDQGFKVGQMTATTMSHSLDVMRDSAAGVTQKMLDLQGTGDQWLRYERSVNFVANTTRGLTKDTRDLIDQMTGVSKATVPINQMAGYFSTLAQSLNHTGKKAETTGLAMQSLIAKQTGIAGNSTLSRMSAYYGRLERQGEAADSSAGKTAVLEKSVGKLIATQNGFGKNSELEAMAQHYRDLAKELPSVESAMSKMASTAGASSDRMKDLRSSAMSVTKAVDDKARSIDQISLKASLYQKHILGWTQASSNLEQKTSAVTTKTRLYTTTVGKAIDEQQGFKRSVGMTEMSSYYRDLEKSSAASKTLTGKTQKASGAIRSMKGATSVAKSGMSGLVKHADAAAGRIMNLFRGVGRVMRRTVLVGAGVAGAALAGLGAIGVKYNGQMDTYQTMMTTYLGSAKEANGLILEAQQFAMKTPLDTAGVMRSATTLVQYGLKSREAMDITKQLADVSAGSKEKMDRLGIAFAQVAAKGKLQAEEVRQLVNAGYNPLKTIAETTGESMGDLLKRMKDGKIPMDEVAAALKKDTDAGGKFHGNVLALATTLPGAVSNIKEMTTALAGNASRGAYKAMTRIAVTTQKFMGILTDGVLKGDGWGASIDRMTKAMRRAGGAVGAIGRKIDQVMGSKGVTSFRKFSSGVSKSMDQSAAKTKAYETQVRLLSRSIAKKKGHKLVLRADTNQARMQLAKFKPKPVTLVASIKQEMGKSKGGNAALDALGFVKKKMDAFGPAASGAMKVVGPMFKDIGKRVGEFGKALSSMAPLWTNMIGPLITGIFKGILSIVDPLLSLFSKLAPQLGKVGTKMKPLAPYFEKLGYVIGMFLGGPILAGIGKLTKGFGLIGKAVRPLGLLISGISKFVFKIVGSVLKLGNTFIMTFARIGGSGTSMFARIMIVALKIITFPARMYAKFVLFVGKMIGSFVVGGAKMAARFLQKVHNMGGGLGKMVSKFVGKMIGAIAKIGAKLKGLGTSFGSTIGSFAISVVNKGIEGLNRLIDRLRSFDTRIPKIGKPFRSLGRLPTLGDGGTFMSGSAIVGERGAELLTMSPRGATITPASHLTERRGASGGSLRAALKSSGGGEVIEVTVVNPTVVDGREIARAATRHTVKRMARA